MIELKKEIISSIPVIELFEKGKENEALPTVIFYHGWESYKERVLEHGYRLAEAGFRALLPEALDHGERKETEDKKQDPLNFWGIVSHNIQEYFMLTKYYIFHGKTDPERIGVAGLSMGGMTTSAILTQTNSVKAAAILMGSPAPIEFTKWLLRNYKIDEVPLYELLDQEVIESRLEELTPISLALQPEKINNRPLYFWHGVADKVVPIHLTEEFVEKNQTEDYGEQMIFEKSMGVGHKVPRSVSMKMAEHFKNHL